MERWSPCCAEQIVAKVDAFSSKTKGVVDTDVDENDGSGTQGDELDLRAARTELCGCSLL